MRRALFATHFAFTAPSVSGERLQRTLRQAADPSWLAALGVSLVSVVMVVGWPEAAGSVTRSLMLGAGVTSALAALVVAGHHADLRRRTRELRRVGHFQELVLEFGTRALAHADVTAVLQEAVACIASSLDVEYCAVLESVADADGALVLRAGVGWPAESLGGVVVAEDGSSMRADHFVTGAWQQGNGVGSGVTVGLRAGNRAFGLLDVCTRGERVFCPLELDFLHSIGDLVGAAIERDAADGSGGMPRASRLRPAS
jgi:hypothetical protein